MINHSEIEKMVKLGPRKIKGTTWDEAGKTKIVKILISHGQALVKSIQFVYVVDGKEVRSEMHGEPSGSKFDIVTFNHPNEYVISVSGYYNSDGLVAITFGTNKREYGPFGQVGGSDSYCFCSRFVYNFRHVSSFGGFHGSVFNSRVHRIGVYVKALASLPQTETETKTDVGSHKK